MIRGRFVVALALVPLLIGAGAPPAPPAPMPPRLLRTLAHNPSGYDASHGPVATDLLLGDLLFHSPHVLGKKAQAHALSCDTCHPNGATHGTFVLGRLGDRPGNVDLSTPYFRPGADNGVDDAVNIPSLRGVRTSAPYGRDGRTTSLAEFTNGVITGEFDGAPLPASQLSALVRYLLELDHLPNANLDARSALTSRASAEAKRGEALFAAPRAGFSGMSCATCHAPSTFFRDGKTHRMGTGRSASPHAIEDGYETPTLLGLRETAPYFHDGRFSTLADVILWFDTSYRLGMTTSERADLTAYVEAVGATDVREDERSLAQRMEASFVYLELLVDGASKDDRTIWAAAFERAEHALLGPPEVAPLAPRLRDARARLASLSGRCASGAALSSLREEVKALHRDLTRLGADWTGALSAR